MNFKVINFDLRIKPSKNEGKVLIIYSNEYFTKTTVEVDIHNIDTAITNILNAFNNSAVTQLKDTYRKQTGLFLQ